MRNCCQSGRSRVQDIRYLKWRREKGARLKMAACQVLHPVAVLVLLLLEGERIGAAGGHTTVALLLKTYICEGQTGETVSQRPVSLQGLSRLIAGDGEMGKKIHAIFGPQLNRP